MWDVAIFLFVVAFIGYIGVMISPLFIPESWVDADGDGEEDGGDGRPASDLGLKFLEYDLSAPKLFDGLLNGDDRVWTSSPLITPSVETLSPHQEHPLDERDD